MILKKITLENASFLDYKTKMNYKIELLNTNYKNKFVKSLKMSGIKFCKQRITDYKEKLVLTQHQTSHVFPRKHSE